MRKESARKLKRLLQHDRLFLTQGFVSLAGVDEAGRGPLAGPVVASAVVVRDFSFSCRVDDSKKMTGPAREAAYAEIFSKSEVGVGIVDHETIDRINIYQATFLAMREAILRLPVPPDCVLVDGPRTPELELKRFAIVDGDALSFSIACASIIAKVTRDRLMRQYDELYPVYGFKKHKGYGTKEHLEALRRHGPCEIHRKSFRPVKLLWKLC